MRDGSWMPVFWCSDCDRDGVCRIARGVKYERNKRQCHPMLFVVHLFVWLASRMRTRSQLDTLARACTARRLSPAPAPPLQLPAPPPQRWQAPLPWPCSPPPRLAPPSHAAPPAFASLRPPAPPHRLLHLRRPAAARAERRPRRRRGRLICSSAPRQCHLEADIGIATRGCRC